MASQLFITKERKFIDGIPPLEWGRHYDSSFIRAAVEYLQKMNEKHALVNGRDLIDNYKMELSLLEDLLRKQVESIRQIFEIERECLGIMEEEYKILVS